MFVYTQSSRLRLREFALGDERLLLDLDSDPEVMRFLSGGEPTPMEQIEKDMPRILGYAQKYNHKLGIWVAELNETPEFVGWFLLRPDKKKPEDIKNLELGYRLKKKFWNQGLATEMSKVLIQKAFSELGADTVYARTHLLNVGSWSVMKKLGMTFVKEYQDEEIPWSDQRAVYYEMTRAQWLSLR